MFCIAVVDRLKLVVAVDIALADDIVVVAVVLPAAMLPPVLHASEDASAGRRLDVEQDLVANNSTLPEENNESVIPIDVEYYSRGEIVVN